MSVFVSHNWKHHNIALGLVDVLKTRDVKAWIDEREVGPGDPLDDKIVQGIIKANCFVLLMTEEYEKSNYCQKELQFAVNKKKHIIPVYVVDKTCIKNDTPVAFQISNLVWLDFYKENENPNDVHLFWTKKVPEFKKLLDALKKDRSSDTSTACSSSSQDTMPASSSNSPHTSSDTSAASTLNTLQINDDITPLVGVSAFEGMTNLTIGVKILELGKQITEQKPKSRHQQQIQILVVGDNTDILRAIVYGNTFNKKLRKQKEWVIKNVLVRNGTIYIFENAIFKSCNQQISVPDTLVTEASEMEVEVIGKDMQISELLQNDYLLGHLLITVRKISDTYLVPITKRHGSPEDKKCKYLKIEDNSGSILVKIWDDLAEIELMQGWKIYLTFMKKKEHSKYKDVGTIFVSSPRSQLIVKNKSTDTNQTNDDEGFFSFLPTRKTIQITAVETVTIYSTCSSRLCSPKKGLKRGFCTRCVQQMTPDTCRWYAYARVSVAGKKEPFFIFWDEIKKFEIIEELDLESGEDVIKSKLEELITIKIRCDLDTGNRVIENITVDF